MAASGKQAPASKKSLLAQARAEKAAMAPIVRRALARHGKAGERVFVVVDDRGARWVAVSRRGTVKEVAATPYQPRRSAPPARKK